MPHNRKFIVYTIVCFLLSLTAIFFLSLADHPFISMHQVLADRLNTDQYVYFALRLPKYCLAFLVGASLSVSGVTFQSLLRNPLADPYILGVSGGASLGYVLGVILGVPFVFLPVFGFLAALLSLGLVYRLAMVRGVLIVQNLLLVGIVFNSFSFALILIINSVANFGQAHQILHLLLGSIESVPWYKVGLVAVVFVVAFGLNLVRANAMNLLSLGDEEAFHLGLSVNREKKIIFFTTSLLVGATVSLCGLIGFVGLIVPHMTRMIVGADHRRVLPFAVLLGGLILVFCEFAAANLISSPTLATRLPVGAVTASIGAPVFVYLFRRNSKMDGQS